MLSFFKMMSFGIKSYASWAQCLASITGKVVSKQAIFERMNSAWIGLVKQLLEIVMAQQAVKQTSSEIFKHFNRVLLQDSTTLHLPDCLSGLFKGNVSRGKAKAVAKLTYSHGRHQREIFVHEVDEFHRNRTGPFRQYTRYSKLK